MRFHCIKAANLGFEIERLEFQRLFDKAVNGKTIPDTDYVTRSFQIGEEKKSFSKLEHAVFNAAHLLGEASSLGGMQASLEIYKNRMGDRRYSESLAEINERIEKLGKFRRAVSRVAKGVNLNLAIDAGKIPGKAAKR